MSSTDNSPVTAGVPAHVPAELLRAGPAPGSGEQGCPFHEYAAMHSEPRVQYLQPDFFRPNGSWTVSRADDVRYVLQHAELFSSEGIAGFSMLLGQSWPLIPLEVDPPLHAKYRSILNGIFSPAKTRELESGVRARAVSLIEEVAGKGECEFIEAFARPFPVSIFMQIMGLPDSDFDELIGYEHDLLHSGTMEERVRGARGFYDYLTKLIAERRRNPTDDLAGFVIKSQIDGRPLNDEEVMGIYYLLVVAGLDTVAASLGLHFRHLAQHAQDQERLRANPSLIPDAIEEFLRRYAIVSTTRFATQDTELAGVAIKKGDRLTVSTMAPSLDPTEFPNPLEVDITRSPNRHVAFSFGPHRCIGSHLARREMIIAVEEWLKRVPPFRVAGNVEVPVRAGGLMSVDALPLTWK